MRPWTLSFLAFLPISVAADQGEPTQTGALSFQGYQGAPAFTVVPREKAPPFHPCANCHQHMQPNPTQRKLAAPPPHPSELDHGKGRIWCLVCHHPRERNFLRTVLDEKVEFDDAYLVCGQCHANRQKDWYFGGHGKRLDNWRGERVLYNCTQCHDAHNPSIKPRKAQPPPPVRAGLEKMPERSHSAAKAWEQHPSQSREIPSEQ